MFSRSFTLIAMSGPASTSHNMYLYSIDGGKTLKEDRGLINKDHTFHMCGVESVGKVAASLQGLPAS